MFHHLNSNKFLLLHFEWRSKIVLQEKGDEMAGLRGYGQWAPETEGVTLTWRDLSVYVPAEKEGGMFKRQSKPYKRLLNAGKKKLLRVQTLYIASRILSWSIENNILLLLILVSGAVKPGTLVALMGSR
jgi:hypothetical protein